MVVNDADWRVQRDVPESHHRTPRHGTDAGDDVVQPRGRVVQEHAAVGEASHVNAVDIDAVVLLDVVHHGPDEGHVVVAGGPVA